MKGPDRILAGFVLGALAIVAVAFFLVLRQPEPTYRDDDTPDGVAHDYLLALQNGDFERAWGALSPGLAGYPDSLEAFLDDVGDQPWRFGLTEGQSRSLRVEPAVVTGDRAIVRVYQSTFHQSGLLESAQSSDEYTMTLAREDDTWRLVDSEGGDYWYHCWDSSDPYCRETMRPPPGNEDEDEGDDPADEASTPTAVRSAP